MSGIKLSLCNIGDVFVARLREVESYSKSVHLSRRHPHDCASVARSQLFSPHLISSSLIHLHVESQWHCAFTCAFRSFRFKSNETHQNPSRFCHHALSDQTLYCIPSSSIMRACHSHSQRYVHYFRDLRTSNYTILQFLFQPKNQHMSEKLQSLGSDRIDVNSRNST